MPTTKTVQASSLTAERLRQLLSYELETGVFRWRLAASNNISAGSIAGCVDVSRGYRKISVDGERHLAHRLAWLYVHGIWPRGLIDHANGVRDDNRLENLRLATRAENAANSRLAINNTSGLKGAHWHKRDQRWRAQMTLDGKTVYLGSFNTREAAHNAYVIAARQQHGKFASDGSQALVADFDRSGA